MTEEPFDPGPIPWTTEGRNLYLAGQPFLRIEPLEGCSPVQADRFIKTIARLLNTTSLQMKWNDMINAERERNEG